MRDPGDGGSKAILEIVKPYEIVLAIHAHKDFADTFSASSSRTLDLL